MKRLMKFQAVIWCILLAIAGCAKAQGEKPNVISAFDAPFLFAYGTWEKKVAVQDKIASLRGEGVNGQGGAGVNANLDLRAHQADWSPALRLRVGANNKVPVLKLMLKDKADHAAIFDFVLPAPGANFVIVTPREGAPLSVPNATEKGVPDFSKIIQWQLIGDWNAGALDVEVASIEVVAPTQSVRQARVDNRARLTAEAEKLRQEREALKAKYATRSENSPQVVNVAPVARDVLSIAITSGKITPGSLTRYEKQEGDKTEEKKNARGEVEEVQLVRGGKNLGWLLGPKRDQLQTREGFSGEPLLEFVADDAANFSVSSKDDAAYAQGVKPLSVGRKSTPTNWEMSSADMEMLHTVYLRLPKPLSARKHYTINLDALNTRRATVELNNDATKVRSEAVHVNQIGFRPDDPAKRAFVSCWMGTGGTLQMPETLNFSLVDDKTGKVVFSGKSELRWPADKPELMQTDRNFSGTDVVRMDFSGFKTPGKYRVSVAGIGSSYPFEIGPDVWKKAFQVQMKGLYNQRSGVELGPPYTNFKKPRDMNPADAAINNTRVTWTKYRAVEGGGENFEAIALGDTGKPAPGWGGYHDAGDWNPRRVTHMKVTMAQLEAFDLFPQTYATLKLNIPQRKGVPDLLTEAIFEFETFHRLQQADGGVGFGLETRGDPIAGEVSWVQSMPIVAGLQQQLLLCDGRRALVAVAATLRCETRRHLSRQRDCGIQLGRKRFRARQCGGPDGKARQHLGND